MRETALWCRRLACFSCGAGLTIVSFLVLTMRLAVAGPDEPVEKGQKPQPQALIKEFVSQWDESAWTSPGGQKKYMRPLSDSGWAARFRALQVLVKHGKEAVPALEEALEKGDVPARILAAQTLGYIAPHASRGMLRKAIASDPVPAVRLYAVDALGMHGGDEAEFFQASLDKEGNRDVKLHLKYALERKSEAIDPAVIRTLVEWDPAKISSAEVGKPAPDFELETVSGKKVRLSQFRGKQAVVLIFVYGDT